VGRVHRYDFNRQQTGDCTGKFVSNRLRTHNVGFANQVTSDQEDINQNDMQHGEESGFKGKITGNLGITHGKC
jgi:hypothetical protein